MEVLPEELECFVEHVDGEVPVSCLDDLNSSLFRLIVGVGFRRDKGSVFDNEGFVHVG